MIKAQNKTSLKDFKTTAELLREFNKVQTDYILHKDICLFFNQSLALLIKYSNSTLGFIGEISSEQAPTILKNMVVNNLYQANAKPEDKTIDSYIPQKHLDIYNLHRFIHTSVESRKPVIENDHFYEIDKKIVLLSKMWLRHFYIAPLCYNDKVLGLVVLGNYAHPFANDLNNLLELLFEPIAKIIFSARETRLKDSELGREHNQIELFEKLSDRIPGMIYQYQLMPNGKNFFSKRS